MNKRDLKLDQYGISKYRYRELSNFCLQYHEFIAEKNNCYSLDGPQSDGINNGKSTPERIDIQNSRISNTTACKAERAYKLSKYIELIERTAIEAGGELYPWIIRAVTEGIGYHSLGIPCYERKYIETRRLFFYLLSLKK